MIEHGHPLPSRPVTVLTLAVGLTLVVGLYLNLTEPFAGTPLGFAGRIVSPIALIAGGAARYARGRLQSGLLAAGIVLSLAGLTLILFG